MIFNYFDTYFILTWKTSLVFLVDGLTILEPGLKYWWAELKTIWYTLEVNAPPKNLDYFKENFLETLIGNDISKPFLFCLLCPVGTVDRIAIRPPSIKGDIQYTSWLEGTLRKAQAKLQDPDMARTLFTIRQLLEVWFFHFIVTLIKW